MGRFPGYDREEKKYDAEVHKDRIMGEHVSSYMEYLQEEDEEVFKKQFASYIDEGIDSGDIEDLMTEAMEKIREDPSPSENLLLIKLMDSSMQNQRNYLWKNEKRR